MINGILSTPFLLPFGVPQRSGVGTLIFSIYTLPIADIIKRHDIEYHLYGDDTLLSLSFKVINPSASWLQITSISMAINQSIISLHSSYMLNTFRWELLPSVLSLSVRNFSGFLLSLSYGKSYQKGLLCCLLPPDKHLVH